MSYRGFLAELEKASVAIPSNESFSKAHMFPATCVKWRLKFHGFPCRADRLAGGGECLVGEDGHDGARIGLGGDGHVVGEAPFGQFPA